MGDIEKETVTVKTYATTIALVIGWVISLATVYFTMAAKVQTANETANSCKLRLDNFNPDIVVYRINELDKKVQINNDKADRIIDMLTRHK